MKQLPRPATGWAKRVRFGAPILMVVALLVSACGGGEEAAPTSSPAAATTAPATSVPVQATAAPTPRPTTAPPPTATAAPVPTGQVRIAVAELFDQSFSPNSGPQMYYLDPVFDHTMGVDHEGKLDATRGLASSWQASADSMTWTLKLRDNVVFSNGVKATSRDVESMIRWVTRPETKVTGGSVLRAAISTIDVPDDSTITFNLKARDLFFSLNWLAPTGQGMISAVIPKAYFEQVGEAGFNRNPIGSGLYVVKENNIGNNIVQEAVARHWYYGVPRFKTVEFRIVPETSTRSALLLTNGIEMAATDRTEGPRLRSQGQLVTTKDSAGVVNVRILEQYKRDYPGYGLNPLADQRVRNALDLAVDRKTLVDTFLKGLAIPSVNYIPMPWDPAFERLPVPAQNLARARQLLQEAGFAGFSLDVYIFEQAGLPEGPQMMEALAVWWEQIGVKVNRISSSYATYRDKWQTPPGLFQRPTVGGLTIVQNRPITSGISLGIVDAKSISRSADDAQIEKSARDWLASPTVDDYLRFGKEYGRLSTERSILIALSEVGEIYAHKAGVGAGASWKTGKHAYSVGINQFLTGK